MTTGGQSLSLYKLQHNGSLARSFQHLCIFFFLSVSGSCVTHPYLVWLRWLDQLDKWVGPGLSGALMTLQMSCNWISIRDGLNPSKSKWPAASSTSETVRSTGKTCSIHRDDAAKCGSRAISYGTIVKGHFFYLIFSWILASEVAKCT